MRETCLTVPADKIATLSNLRVQDATLTPPFTPDNAEYSTRVARTLTEIQIVATATSRRAWSSGRTPRGVVRSAGMAGAGVGVLSARAADAVAT